MYFWFLFLEVYLHRVNLLNFLCRVLFVSFISYDTLNKVLYVCMYCAKKELHFKEKLIDIAKIVPCWPWHICRAKFHGDRVMNVNELDLLYIVYVLLTYF